MQKTGVVKEDDFIKMLLVSDNEADVKKIKKRLEETIRIACHIWHCITLKEALEHLNKRGLQADVIILDLGLVGTSNPKEIYKKIGRAAQRTPIIVLTGEGEEEHDLATFVMEAGASDHMIRGQFDRLLDAIEFSLIRHKIIQKTRDESTSDLRDAHDKGIADLDIEKTRHASETKDRKDKTDKESHEQKQLISWITGGYSVEENSEKS